MGDSLIVITTSGGSYCQSIVFAVHFHRFLLRLFVFPAVMSPHTENTLSTYSCEARADAMSTANGTKERSTVLLATEMSTALLQLLWARVMLCVDSLISMPDV